MATLVSPGVQVDVIDQSFYAPSGPGSVPFILIATQQDKLNPSGLVANGSTAASAGKVFSITGRRELLDTFGTPNFPRNANGNSIFGSELSEWGLLAAHSVLDVCSRAYVMRANIDLNQLVGTGVRPTGNPLTGSLWLDTGTNSWGIFEWSSATQSFIKISPRVITSTADLNGSVPLESIGVVGDYAVVTTNSNNPVYFKNVFNQWVLVGSTSWQDSWQAVNSTTVNPNLTPGNSIEINGDVVTLTGSSVNSLASDINTANITGVSAYASSGYLLIYATSAAKSDGSTIDGVMHIRNVSGTPLAALGITAGYYASPAVQLSFHTSVPEWKTHDTTPRPTGSVWVKTTAVANGANFQIYKWNSATERWVLQSAPLYANDQTALRYLDPTRGGLGVSQNNLYVQYDVNENSTVTYKVFRRASTLRTTVTGEAMPTMVAGESFIIRSSIPGSTAMQECTVNVTDTDVYTLASDILACSNTLTYVSASVNAEGAIVIEHVTGGVLEFKNASGTPLTRAGITSSTTNCRAGNNGYIIGSNWTAASYTAAVVGPVSTPDDGALWYASTPLEVDLMIHNGTNWKGYQTVSSDARGFDLTQTDPLGPIISSSAPKLQSDNTALVYGDIWIDTSDLENYPKIYRYQSVGGENKWVGIDLADDTSENGILFADARWDTDGTTDIVLDSKPAITDLLMSNYLDVDAPSASIYPRGMLLFNTRRSTYNVKKFTVNYFNTTSFPLQIIPSVKNAWVSVSGNRTDGVPYFGRKAVRNLIVSALRSAIDSSEEIREDARFFNLMATPGYPELIQNMVALNTARRETAFVIADLPMGLSSDATSIENYLLNTAGDVEDSEEAIVTNSAFVSAFYPSAALTNDTTGSQVVVPASYAMLRTFINSDNKSFPWFAPAGEQRGQVDNVTTMGYINRKTGEFVSVGTRQGLRDLLYVNRINPIALFNGVGILNYGQKTRASASTALDRVNVARLINYIRYQLEKITKPLIFEPNDKITRNEAKQAVESMLNEILANRGLYDYLVVCDESNNTPDRIDRNELYIDVAIEPAKAVEFIYIPVRILNTGAIANNNAANATLPVA